MARIIIPSRVNFALAHRKTVRYQRITRVCYYTSNYAVDVFGWRNETPERLPNALLTFAEDLGITIVQLPFYLLWLRNVIDMNTQRDSSGLIGPRNKKDFLEVHKIRVEQNINGYFARSQKDRRDFFATHRTLINIM